MKYFLLALLFTVSTIGANAQLFDWTAYGESSGFLRASGVTTDEWGNTYTVGTCLYSIEFSDTLIDFTSSYDHIFITKHDRHGERQWVRIYSGSFDCRGYDIKTDNVGNVYFSGRVVVDIDFPTSILHSDFLAKLDPNGEFLWAQPIPYGVSGFDIDENNNCFVSFKIRESGYFGSEYLDVMFIGDHVGIGKFNSDGLTIWATVNHISGFSQYGFNIDLNNSGNMAVSTESSGISGLGAIIDTSSGLIIKELGLASDDSKARTVLVDDFGNYIVGGTFQGTVNFGSTVLSSIGITDIFIASYDSSGTENWVKQIGGLGINNGNTRLTDMGTDKDGNYFICGRIPEIAIFGTDTIMSWGPSDAFIAKYDKDGNYYWAQQLGSSSSDKAKSLDVNPDGVVAIAGEFRGGIGVFGNDTLPALVYSISKLFVSRFVGNNNTISGSTYFDLNNNGVKDDSEPIAANTYVSAQPASRFSFSDYNGDYLIQLDTGSIDVFPKLPIYHTSNPSSYTFNFNTFSMQESNVDFGFVPIPGIEDVQIDLVGISPTRPGFSTSYQISCKNIGTDTLSGNISLKFDSLLVFDSASLDLQYQGSDSLSWSYDSLIPYNSAIIKVYFTVKPTTTLGVINTMIADVTPFLTDTVPADNIDTLHQVIIGSFDPNDKAVSPSSDVLLSYVQEEKPFEYLIRFQNTGTDTAFTVAVVDTISALFDLSTFEVLSSSHSYRVEFQNDRRVEFIFNNINLPDSTTNYLGSNGFVKYKLKPHASASVGDEFLNTAFIYFDYNLPVITNTTSNKIYVVIDIEEDQLNSSSDLIIYPNPTENNTLNYSISLKDSGLMNIEFLDLNGKKIQSLTKSFGQGVNTGTIGLDDFPKGVYLIQFSGKEFRFNKKIIIL